MTKGGGGGWFALMHVYVLEHTGSLCYRTAWWMFTKLGSDEGVPVNWETEKNEKKRKETERKKTKRKQGEK